MDNNNNNSGIIWQDDARERLKRAPIFLREMVKKLAEKRAAELGYKEITGELLDSFKNEMMNMPGSGRDTSTELKSEGQSDISWTEDARERLAAIPEFFRPILTQIIEESAKELGYNEIDIEVFSKIESIGEETTSSAQQIKWTEEASLMLDKKIENSPPISIEFVRNMLKEDAEDAAIRLGYNEINRDVLSEIWESPQDTVIWSKEARERVENAPDFVRKGIKKAAERRARRRGDKVITSELLTKFRNEAMMKAVRRIKGLGHTELTFDAFDTAEQKIQKLRDNKDAHDRLNQIKKYVTEKGDIGLIDSKLINKMKAYLKEV
ncbi:MAG: PCP reductase family protein [Nitrospirota bacterium]